MPESKEHRVVRRGIIITLSFTIGLWLILVVQWLGNFDFARLGIYPRTLSGSIGILTGPLIHAGVFHLLANTLPLMILGFGLMYFYYRIALEVFAWIYLTTGFWVWIIGRNAYHIGASGIIYGLMAFMLMGGILRRNIRSLAISMAVFFLYGGMLYGIFPVEPHVSWESHLMGLLAGVFIAIFFRKEPIYAGDVPEEERSDENDDEDPGQAPYFTEPENSYGKDIRVNYELKPRKKHGPQK